MDFLTFKNTHDRTARWRLLATFDLLQQKALFRNHQHDTTKSFSKLGKVNTPRKIVFWSAPMFGHRAGDLKEIGDAPFCTIAHQ